MGSLHGGCRTCALSGEQRMWKLHSYALLTIIIYTNVIISVLIK